MNFSLLFILPLCLAISFLCAGMEAGVFSLSRWRIRHQMRAGEQRAAVLNNFLEHSENFLWTILVGNTLAAFTGLALIATALIAHFAGHPLLSAALFIVAIFLFYIFCDLLPKMLFRQFPNRLALMLAKPFRLLHLLLSPLVTIVEGFASLLLRWTGGKIYTGHVFANRQELRLFMRDTAQELTSEEKAMINRVLDLQTLSLRQVALAFPQDQNLQAKAKMQEAIELFRTIPQTAVPVWHGEGKGRKIAGVLNLKAFLFSGEVDPNAPVSRYLGPVLYLSEDTQVERALHRMQKTGHRLAVVISRNHQELGVVTLESVLKIIFGDVRL